MMTDADTSSQLTQTQTDGTQTQQQSGASQGQQQTQQQAGAQQQQAGQQTQQGAQQQGQQQQAAGQQSQQQQAPVQLTPEQIAELAARTAANVNQGQQGQQQQQTQQRQLTPEEINKQFNVVEPSQEQITSLFEGGEKAVTTMRQLLHDTSKMAVTIAAHYTHRIVEQLRNEFAPARDYANEQTIQKTVGEFYDKHPDLKAYEPILVAVKNNLEASGFRGTKEQVFERVSQEARTILKNAGITPAAVQQQQQQTGAQQQSQPKTQQMSTLTGGRAGAAGAAPTGAQKTTAQAIFGE